MNCSLHGMKMLSNYQEMLDKNEEEGGELKLLLKFEGKMSRIMQVFYGITLTAVMRQVQHKVMCHRF